jgi:hypothetical protein
VNQKILRSLRFTVLSPLVSHECLAAAGGIPEGIGALSGILYLAIGFFIVAWCAVWLILRSRLKTGYAAAGRPYWLRDPGIPLGLRVLALLQYLLAFAYGLIGFLRLFAGNELQHHRVDQDWAAFNVLFCVIFSTLAILSANAYIIRSQKRGFELGVSLGWFCVANGCLYLFSHGWYPGLEPITLALGIVLLALLNWRYRRYFDALPRSRAYLRLMSLTRRTALVLGLILSIQFVNNLLVTTVLPQYHEGAMKAVFDVGNAMRDYRAQHGDWPASLDLLDSSVELTYRWSKVEYCPESDELRLESPIPLESDIVYRLVPLTSQAFGPLRYSAMGSRVRPLPPEARELVR